ncbi:TonB-dependent receptor [Rufibacter psychrotolerans]|uniref:TonB-dependent receptor n=1 Tax=Rufibacter psychrotolerans TaxID=2812556 RepID=UPI001967597E|nr:TonB-dependent receptor [Rufibacter sp. SYSU D00308]
MNVKILYATLLAFLVPFALLAQQGGRSVSGLVTNQAGQPVEFVTVALEGTVLGTNTNADGSFLISGVKPGTYTLRVGGVGFSAVTQTVDLTGQNAVVSITIKENRNALQEVIISANRSVEALDETPASVHVLDHRTLQTQSLVSSNISNILAATVPGLALNSNTTSNVGQTLRGRNVLILVDGIPQSTPLRAGGREVRTIDPSAIERVEVVKGATAVYGNGADGGLINYITKKPTLTQPFSATTTVLGTGMLFHGGDTFGGRISQQVSGQLKAFDYVATGAFERTGVYKDGEGQVISPLYGLGETNTYNAFAKLGYNLGTKHRVEGMYNYFGSRQQTEYVLQEGKYAQAPSIGVKGEQQGEDEGTRYNHNAQLRYTGKSLFLNTDLDLSAYVQSFYTIYGYTPYFENGGQSTILSNKKGLRLNLNTPLNLGPLKTSITYGVDYLQDVTSQPLVDGRIWVPEMDMVNLAPYAQLQVNAFEHFIFKAGYRYDNVSIDVPDFQQLRLSAGGGGNAVQGGTLDFDAHTFNLGLRYTAIAAFKPFISYSQGFSIIDVGRYVRGARENYISQMDIEPVIVNNYEAGFHSRIGKVAFSGAYFISTSELGANLKANEQGTYTIERAPERIEGFEVVADYFVTDKITIGANAAFSEGRVDLNNNGAFHDEENNYLNGTRIAPLKIASYLRVEPLAKLNLNLQWIYSGERDRFAPNSKGGYNSGEGPVQDFHVVNLSGNYQLTHKLGFNLGIENLLDEAYYLPQAYWYGRDDNFTRASGARFQIGATYKW